MRSEGLKRYYAKLMVEIDGVQVKFIWVPREANVEADLLSRKALEDS